MERGDQQGSVCNQTAVPLDVDKDIDTPGGSRALTIERDLDDGWDFGEAFDEENTRVVVATFAAGELTRVFEHAFQALVEWLADGLFERC